MNECTIELKVLNNSPEQMAYALVEYFFEKQGDTRMAIIDSEEVAKHILLSVEAEKQRLELIERRGAYSE